MDEYKSIYKANVDSMCDNNLKLEAEDILNARPTVTELPGVTHKMKNYKKIFALVAACVCTVGAVGVVAGASGYGPLASLFSSKAAVETENIQLAHDDRISAQLVENGYSIEINQTQSVNGFDVTFEGVTGDWTNAQMLFTIKTNDAEYAATHDKLYMTVYKGFDAEMYSNNYDLIEWPNLDIVVENCEDEEAVQQAIDAAYAELGYTEDEFWSMVSHSTLYDTAVAYQSTDDPTVYTLTYGAYPYYVTPGATIYTQVRSIRSSDITDIIQPEDDEIMLNCEFHFTLPENENTLATSVILNYNFDEAQTFTDNNNVEYHVTEVSFGQYKTELITEFYYAGTALESVDSNFWNNYETIGAAHQATMADVRLVVDGTEYSATELGGVYADDSGIRRGMATFPEINFEEATSVVFTYNGTEVVIK